jgi:hypothetical protein
MGRSALALDQQFHNDDPMVAALVQDTDIDLVRHQLSVLADSRLLSGLNPEEESCYQELCKMELTLLCEGADVVLPRAGLHDQVGGARSTGGGHQDQPGAATR